MTGGMAVARQVRIRGLVQGVGYRDWMRRTATRLGVAGWVRNRADGTVEALVHGPEAAVAELLRACRRGPAGAVVTGIGEQPGHGEGSGRFVRRPTC